MGLSASERCTSGGYASKCDINSKKLFAGFDHKEISKEQCSQCVQGTSPSTG